MRPMLALILVWQAQFVWAAAKLKVTWQSPSDWIAVARGEPPQFFAPGTLLITVEAGALPISQVQFIETSGPPTTCTLVSQPPADATAGTLLTLKIEVPLGGESRSRQGYLEIRTSSGDPVQIPIRVQAGEADRVAEVLGSGAWQGLAVVAIAFVVACVSPGKLQWTLGKASWDSGSLATNTAVAAAVLTAILGLP